MSETTPARPALTVAVVVLSMVLTVLAAAAAIELGHIWQALHAGLTCWPVRYPVTPPHAPSPVRYWRCRP